MKKGKYVNANSEKGNPEKDKSEKGQIWNGTI